MIECLDYTNGNMCNRYSDGATPVIMQKFIITEYAWPVVVFYNADYHFADNILFALEKIGIGEKNYYNAEENLRSTNVDRGLCYSNYKKKASVLVISNTSTPDQFMNTYAHEVKHLERHIEQAEYIDPYSEQSAYLAGSIAQLMFPEAKKFLCCCYGFLK